MDQTNDPALRSFIPVSAESHFPIQNLPYGVFRRNSDGSAAAGVAIGDYVLDLSVLEECGPLPTVDVFSRPSLNRFLSLGQATWTSVREALSRLLRAEAPTLRDNHKLRDRVFVPMT